ncbi:unnamed protein product, partial [Heterosigma akashiwo]
NVTFYIVFQSCRRNDQRSLHAAGASIHKHRSHTQDISRQREYQQIIRRRGTNNETTKYDWTTNRRTQTSSKVYQRRGERNIKRPLSKILDHNDIIMSFTEGGKRRLDFTSPSSLFAD